MSVYTESQSESILWPAPIERVFQSLPSGPSTKLAPKLPHLSDWEALCVGALPLIPRESRPHGLITWASEMFAVSRTSIYALGRRIQEQILSDGEAESLRASGLKRAASASERDVEQVEVTPERVQR